KAIKSYKQQELWRIQSEGDLQASMNAYLSVISGTIGARQQEKLSSDQALYIAGCNAVHRDISLNF
ncbi:MAG: hypothetical protein P8I83_04135, partial [Paracoccaceae bacterium]|nr:hypothetical protein [Paracoccaceae bacterium]